jgi:hypothetical protein
VAISVIYSTNYRRRTGKVSRIRLSYKHIPLAFISSPEHSDCDTDLWEAYFVPVHLFTILFYQRAVGRIDWSKNQLAPFGAGNGMWGRRMGPVALC